MLVGGPHKSGLAEYDFDQTNLASWQELPIVHKWQGRSYDQG